MQTILIQDNGHAEHWLYMEIEAIDFLQGTPQHRTAASLQRDDERERGVRISGPLQNRVDADSIS